MLVIDDDRGMCEMLELGLRKRGFDVIWRTQPLAALHILPEEHIEAIVVDLNMPGLKGTEFCQRVLANRPDLPVIVITAFGSLETAIAAIRAGAYDFLTKPFEVDTLALALQRAVQHRALREEVKSLRRAVASSQCFEELIGTSPAMRRVYDLILRVAETDVSVLITGESGTGKELVARELHRRSQRADRPFIKVNCAAVPRELYESEFFGHAKGSFTGALRDRAGRFELADGGTLFLDEVGEIPLDLQAKLLRVLQEGELERVGDERTRRVDVRVISATNRKLRDESEAGRFRQDLYYRLSVFPIELPPLRNRVEDIPLLAEQFLERLTRKLGRRRPRLTLANVQQLQTYSWPGNVRELQHVLERASIGATDGRLRLELPSEQTQRPAANTAADASERILTAAELREFEANNLRAALRATAGRIYGPDGAAERLGMKPTTLASRIKALGISGQSS